jgi:hypothetical protein
MCQGGVVVKQPTREPSTMTKSATETTIHTIGLDIAKNSFSLHGFDEAGITVLTLGFKARSDAGVVCETASLQGRSRGLCIGALLGA